MASQFERILAKARRARQSGKLDEARQLFENCLKIFPNNAQLNLDLAEILMRLECFEIAAGVYARLLEKDPKQPTVLANLGGALLRQGKLLESKSVLDYALELDSKNIYARINLGGVLQGLERFDDALKNALEAVSLDPTHALAFNNLGSAFSDLGLYAEAKHAFETASMLDPTSVDALLNLAGSESKLNEPESALRVYNKVLMLLRPHDIARKDAVRFFACFEHATLGNLGEYWEGYNCGFSPMIPKTGARSPDRKFTVPLWDGSDFPNKTLLIWREQGVGDEILFSSVFHELDQFNLNVILECDPRLVSVWQRTFPKFTVREQSYDPESMLPGFYDYDYHIPICSLGGLFRRTVESFQKFRPFLIPRPDLADEYKERVDSIAKGRPKIGILWRSIKLTPTRVFGYTNPSDWNGILDREDLCFVSLQYNLHDSERDAVRQKFGDTLNIFEEINLKDDFERTIALVSNLDLVISPDTTMFEIAGSLGIQTFLMSVSNRGYYGKLDTFIFYPSVELIRASTFDSNSALEALELTRNRLVDLYGPALT